MSKKKHILFLCGWYPSKVFPYNGDFIQRHAIAIRKLHKVSVLHLVTSKNIEKPYVIEENKNQKEYIGYIRYTKNPVFKLYFFLCAFFSILKRIGSFDLVHVNEILPYGFLAIYLKYFRNTPYLITEHWTGFRRDLSLFNLLKAKLVVRFANFLCPVSSELKAGMIQNGLEGDYRVVANVVDGDLFIPKMNIIESNELKVLHVSSMNDKHKNVSGMLKAIAMTKRNMKLTLIGEKCGKFKLLAKELGVLSKVEFIEQLAHEKIPTFMKNSDVYVSFSNYETWGITMIEAVSCGTKVISTPTGILHELNNKEFFELVNFNDTKELSSVLEKIKPIKDLKQKQNWNNFVKNNFGEEAIAQKFSELYCEML